MRIPPALSYSVRRLALFAGTLLLASVALPGANPIAVLAVATLVSAVLSYFLLAGPRTAMANSVEARLKGIGKRIDASARAEDAALDAAESSGREVSTGNSRESGEDATSVQ